MKWGEIMQEQKSTGQNIKYMIHTIPSRLWYVQEFLVPSMVKQGIKKEDIIIYNDVNYDGNLKSFINSSKTLDYDCWHLQDDIVISSKFKEETEKHYADVMNGFCNIYSKDFPVGYTKPNDMWYSFPCIFIKKEIMDEFLEWLDNTAPKITKYSDWIRLNKYDDSLFKAFLEARHEDMIVYNMVPNIINHVDYLINGSVINSARKKDKNVSSLYWEEPPELIEKLRKDISESYFTVSQIELKPSTEIIKLPFEIKIKRNNQQNVYVEIIKELLNKYKESQV